MTMLARRRIMPDDQHRFRLLLVDDDETFLRMFGGALEEEGFQVETATSGMAALDRVNRQSFDVSLVDLRMPAMDGLSLLAELQRRHPSLVTILLTGYGSVPSTVEAMRCGAANVISKADSVPQVAQAVRDAVEAKRRSRDGERLQSALFDRQAYFGMVGRSPAMRTVFETIGRFQDADEPALICGESGTGKELVARALHAGGPRATKPIIAVNCASLRENFVENELFGHVRGAFTGANEAKQGLFAIADEGTLHIDEIAEMPESTQAALLRVLDTGRFRPIGGTREESVSARVVASTNRDLAQLVDAGVFRLDLYYRLCVCRIDIPPLRQRIEDIPLLVNHFLDTSKNAKRFGARLTDAALDALMSYSWPGNVRELLNQLERAALIARDRPIRPDDLGISAPSGGQALSASLAAAGDITLEELERDYILHLLKRENGNAASVARILEVDPTTIRRKLRRWDSSD